MHLDKVVSAWKDGKDRICRNAPHLIVAHASKGNRTAPAACTIALTYLELAVVSFGFGACLLGGLFKYRCQFLATFASRFKASHGPYSLWRHDDRISQVQISQTSAEKGAKDYLEIILDLLQLKRIRRMGRCHSAG